MFAKRLFALTFAAATLAFIGARPADAVPLRPVARAQDPVTEIPEYSDALASRYIEVICAAFEVKLTPEQVAKYRKFIKSYWDTGEEQDQKVVVFTGNLKATLLQYKATERVVYLRKLQPLFLHALYSGAKQGEDECLWFKPIYETQNPPLAPGKLLPLTRNAALGLLETSFLMRREAGEKVPVMSDRLRAEWLTVIAREYPKMPEEQQMRVHSFTSVWAELSYLWSNSTAQQKAQLRASFRQQYVGGGEEAARLNAQANGMMRNYSMNMMTDQMNNYYANSRVIMGGSYWDASQNRYVVSPGIKTEFN